MIEQAEKYHSFGLSVIPVNNDKVPIVKRWTTNRITPNAQFNKAFGIGLVCGKLSKSIETVDIDCKYDLTGSLYDDYTRLIEEAAPGLLSRLVIQKTRNNGYHLIYRCASIEGNLELAQRGAIDEEKKENEKIKVLIETRGEGGYICIEPTPGYSVVQGSLSDIKEITPDERNILLDTARTFHQIFKDAPVQLVKDFSDTNNSPFQDYNNQINPIELLEAHGWKQVRQVGKFIHLKRPGTTKSLWSASINIETKQFHVFTKSSEFEEKKNYSPAAVFCKLEAGDNWKKCAELLKAKGYGDKLIRNSETAAKPIKLEESKADEILALYESYKISALKPIEKPIPIVTIQGKEICTPGNITAISGKAKSAKTAITNIFLSKAIATSNGCDAHEEIIIKPNEELKAIVHIDTEQSTWHSYRNFKNALLKRALLDREPAHYYSYNIRGMIFSEYQPFLTNIFLALNEKHGGIFLVVIDGGADFVSDTNDKSESEAKVSFFSRLAVNYDTSIIMICHLNPGEGKSKMQGHFGTSLEKKAESILRIRKDGDISYLEPDEFRNAGKSDFTPMPFKYDQAKGYHVFLDGVYTSNNEVKLKELAEFVFTEERRHKDATKMITEFEGCVGRTAKKRITQLVDAGLIIRREGEGNQVLYALKK